MKKRRALFNMISSIVLQVVMILSNFIIPRLTIINYGSSINGLINSITQFLSYIILLESGVGSVIQVKYYNAFVKKDNILLSQIYKESKIFFNAIGYIAIGYVISLCFLYPIIIGSNIPKKTVIILIIIISASTFAQYFFGLINQCLLQADQKMYIVNTAKILVNIFNIIIFILLIKLNSDIFTLKGISIFILTLIPLCLALYTKKNYAINKTVNRNKEVLKDKFNGLGQHIAAFTNGNTDIIILTIFLGVLEVSVYSVYYIVITGLRSVESALNNGVSAAFGNLIAEKKYEKVKRIYTTYDHLNIIVVFSLFTIAYFMIIPFIRLYTAGSSDINYIRPVYAAIVLLSEGISCLMCSYTCIIFAAGHFKQTMRNCYIEAGINIVISLLLVKRLGLIGVGIGTLIAVIYKAVDYIFYLSKNIINWNIGNVLYRLLVNFIGFVFIFFSVRSIPYNNINSVKSWILYATLTGIITVSEYLLINSIFCKKQMKDIINIFILPIIKKLNISKEKT